CWCTSLSCCWIRSASDAGSEAAPPAESIVRTNSVAAMTAPRTRHEEELMRSTIVVTDHFVNSSHTILIDHTACRVDYRRIRGHTGRFYLRCELRVRVFCAVSFSRSAENNHGSVLPCCHSSNWSL